MRHDALLILNCIQPHDITTRSLHEKAVNVFHDKMDSAQFITDLDAEMRSADCLHCNNQPFCRLCLALIRYKRNEILSAKALTEEAILGFRIRGLEWNEGVAHWLMGILLIELNSHGFAERSLERALHNLTTRVRELQVESEYSKAKECAPCISAIESALQEARKISPAPLEQPIPISTGISENVTVTPELEGYMILPWIPVYGEVEAGTHGPIWIEMPKPDLSEVSRVVIKDDLYSLYSLKYGDRKITLVHDREYGWVKVHGHSMNDAKPVRIENKDYVLFYKAPHPNQSEIVIAAQPESPGAKLYSYMVKRYWNDSNELISETTMSGPQYEPILLTRDYRIIGIVVAVAKSLNVTMHSVPPNKNIDLSTPNIQLSTEESKLYNKLTTRALGRKEIIDSLLNEAHKKLPKASRLELLKRVDKDWTKDNTQYDS